jgi:hypothetical protein
VDRLLRGSFQKAFNAAMSGASGTLAYAAALARESAARHSFAMFRSFTGAIAGAVGHDDA